MNENTRDEIFFDPSSSEAESYKSVRTYILNANEKDIKMISITSIKESEGKTAVCLNLGFSFSLSNKKVLIVDLDYKNPSLNEVLEINNKIGLSEYFHKSCKLMEIINKITDKMDAITFGEVTSSSFEMLQSKEMKEFIIDIRDKYDFVIFNAPIISNSIDSLAISKNIDGMVLVCGMGDNDTFELQKVKEQITDLNCRVIGMVLTK